MNPRVIPHPVECSAAGSSFVMTPGTAVRGPEAFVSQIRRDFGPATGFAFGPTAAPNAADILRGSIEPARFDRPESYVLEVTENAVHAVAADAAGLFYAVQTLRQLMPPEVFRASRVHGVPWEIPCVRIADHPRFAWRGVMLDCSRHFFDAAYVKRFIDLLALHKFNVFHWHLTDDQGWRPEIKKYPKLTEIGAWRAETLLGHCSADKKIPRLYDGVRYGGFYTQDEMRDVVSYAADRHVTVVPEIELPGHSRAAIAAYPELGNTPEPWPVGTTWGIESHILNAEESTLRFYQDVLDEMLDIFPSRYVHLGGDEACMDEWKVTPRIHERVEELGLANEQALQGYMIRRMDNFLATRGRRMVGWDEILENDLEPGATVMNWRDREFGIAAAKRNHDVIMCPNEFTYLDFYQAEDMTRSEPLAGGGHLPLEKVYQFDPVPQALEAEHVKRVLGGQAQLWTEYIPNADHIHYMMYPRAMAMAETLWTPAARKDYVDFRRRATHHMRILQRLGVHGRPID